MDSFDVAAITTAFARFESLPNIASVKDAVDGSISFSKASQLNPNGAIQLRAKASSIYFISSPCIVGVDRGIRFSNLIVANFLSESIFAIDTPKQHIYTN